MMDFARDAAFAVNRATAPFKPEYPPIMGMSVLVSRFVPKGTILMMGGHVYMDSEYTALALKLGYEPLLSRHTLGAKEAERDRRLRG